MNYQEATSWLFNQIPNYQKQGGDAYKPGLERMQAILKVLGQPHEKLKVIHVAGTNGKGSVCHILGAVLQNNHYKTGIFTSPHIFDFRERIKINGVLIPENIVVAFVNNNKDHFLTLGLSFFEITAALAFVYFADQKVDFAIIETGMGGRLDATNVVYPLLSIITNIGFDHVQFLGNTIAAITKEKAGIIKFQRPVVCGSNDLEVQTLIREKAAAMNAVYYKASSEEIKTSLHGAYQAENAQTAMAALAVLKSLGSAFNDDRTYEALQKIQELTKFIGRFQILKKGPTVVIDVAHNLDGVRQLINTLNKEKYKTLRMVYGTSSDKDFFGVMELFAGVNAVYYLTEFDHLRTAKKEDLAVEAKKNRLNYQLFDDANMALNKAMEEAQIDDYVVVCGSFYLIASLSKIKDLILS